MSNLNMFAVAGGRERSERECANAIIALRCSKLSTNSTRTFISWRLSRAETNFAALTISSYSATQAGGGTLGIMVINKDPQKSAQVQFTLKNFNHTSVQSYMLASSSPTTIITSISQPWSSVTGTPNVTLSSAVFDAYEGAPACAGTITLTNPTITDSRPKLR